MFGELITFFYYESGLSYEDNLSFFYKNKEIPSYCCDNLRQLQINTNSKIWFKNIKKQFNAYEYNIRFSF